MITIKRILVLEDLEQSQHIALHRAAQFAEQNKAELEVFNCGYTPIIETAILFEKDIQARARQQYIKRAREKLEVLAAPYRDQGLKINTDAQWEKSVPQGVLNKIEAYQPDLVVLHNHHRGRLSRFLSNYTEWQLVKYSPVPLLLVRLETETPHAPTVVALEALTEDETTEHYQIAKHSLAVAQLLASTTADAKHPAHLIHCHQSHESMAAFLEIGTTDYLTKARRTQEALLQKFVAEQGMDTALLHFVEGHPVKEIVRYADNHQAQMIIIGSSGKSLMEKVVLGSTVQEVIEHASCDVLVTKPYASYHMAG